jgi:hypothetical protein
MVRLVRVLGVRRVFGVMPMMVTWTCHALTFWL